MHPVVAFAGAAASFGALANAAANVLDIGLVFPRANETYELGDGEDFPVVFALQNPQVVEHLAPRIEFWVLNKTRDENGWLGDNLADWWFDFSRRNYTDEASTASGAQLLWHKFPINTEGPFTVAWKAMWRSCDESDPDNIKLFLNETFSDTGENFGVDFTIKKTRGATIDLIAGTANTTDSGEDCANGGHAIEITDKTHTDVPISDRPEDGTGTCVVLPSSSPTRTSNPCKVKIDKKTVESMETADFERACRSPYKPDNCPEEDSAGLTLATALGVTGFAAAMGAVLLLA